MMAFISKPGQETEKYIIFWFDSTAGTTKLYTCLCLYFITANMVCIVEISDILRNVHLIKIERQK